MFKDTNFKVVFISTLFPRQEFFDNGVLRVGLKEFNESLLQKSGSFLKKTDKTNLVLRIVDMTAEFGYDYEQLVREGFYCARSQDGTHICGISSEKYLTTLNSDLRKYRRKQEIRRRSERKPVP